MWVREKRKSCLIALFCVESVLDIGTGGLRLTSPSTL